MIHALIVGPRGVGKTTLINRVLKELKKPVYGFQTKKETSLADAQMREPVYIYEPDIPRNHSLENLLGYCSRTEGFRTITGVFDNYAPKILNPIPDDSVIVFDEIGFMESNEKQFCNAILSRLDGDIPVIAAVKDKKGFAFLEKVRTHHRCRCFYITEENRDILFLEVLDFMRTQIDLNHFTKMQQGFLPVTPEYSVEKWNRRAESWKKEREHSRKSDERVHNAIHLLEQRGILNNDCHIADIGCGPGRFVAGFAQKAHSVLGLDISEKMIAHGIEYIQEQGIPNVVLRTCDFQTLDIEKEGYKKAFDLVFSSMTPAIHDLDGIMKCMEMSRAWCCNISHLSGSNQLRERISEEVFGRKLPGQWNGRWFYSLFNILYLLGYKPETSYETRHQEIRITPDEEYVAFIMEHMLPENEHSSENADKILSWLNAHADADGCLLEVTDSCYGTILWDIRDKTKFYG